MYKETDFTKISAEVLEQLQKGAFLTVSDGERTNTMTIGWGSVGFVWKKPIFMVMVRYSRYTHEIISKAKEFTVSVPLGGQLKDALNVCGKKSGRDIDKFKECSLKTEKGLAVDTPIISDCDAHIECRIVYRQGMDGNSLAGDINKNCYSTKDYHVLYYGEILKAYKK
ncbi:MAG: flavin reductase family protein [Bacillota bacterium]|nr:flavin reductase family protein [Bacillota bacterium]MDD3297947.1 flavin reductase family protein [Bacillota bacterium]MDD3851412.1 flavin reductase family protein [Bacillota bacterium]MDD4707394.1 flavin reductase family protein [Bacillota bacterium]